jgi:hypothetical protein
MFVSRTRSSGTPAAGAHCRKPAENFIHNHLHTFPENTFPVHTIPLPLERVPNAIVQSFYTEEAEEGERPFLCTPSPQNRRYSQTG